jgi:hypothetical protein
MRKKKKGGFKMEILKATWGGKAEHGELTFDANVEGNVLVLTATDGYYSDWNGPQLISEEKFVERFEINNRRLNQHFLYNRINELIEKNNIYYGYKIKESQIKPLSM